MNDQDLKNDETLTIDADSKLDDADPKLDDGLAIEEGPPPASRMPGFDEAYYRATYPDVADYDGPALQHYLEHGWRQGRKPSLGFSGESYLATNPDVLEAQICPLVHFLSDGIAEGRGGWREPDL